MKYTKRLRFVSMFLVMTIVLSTIFTGKVTLAADGDGISELWIEASAASAASYADGRKATDMVRWGWSRNGDGKYYLMVPQSADMSNLKVFFTASESVKVSGAAITSGQATDVFTGGGEFNVTCGSFSYTVVVKKTSAIASMFISTSSGNLDAVHADQNHKEPSKMLLVEADGTTVAYNGDLDQIKGRGNATWSYDKKPYNIKLNKKTALLGMGTSKKWSLIANWVDHSHIRNTVAYTLADEVGIEFSSKLRPVDLYINNEYKGLYMLTEKVEIGDPLVNITDLTAATEKVNDADLSTYSQGGTNGYQSNTYKYSNIPNDPADITGGYLMEYELNERYQNEASGFVTSIGQAIVIKYPEYASKAQVEYIREFVQDMENAVYSSTGYNNKGKHYTEYIDEESFAKMYVIQEFCMNLDAGITSFYIYKDSDLVGDGKLHAAPIWDFDNSLGNWKEWRDNVDLTNPEVWWANKGKIYGLYDTPHVLTKLYNHKSFKQRAVRQWHTLFVPAVDKIINESSTADTRVIKYIGDYKEEIRDSVGLDRILWNNASSTIDDSVGYVRNFIERRAAFLSRSWSTSISDLNIGTISQQAYTGSQIQPGVVIKDMESILRENTDYELSYSSNNTDIGEVTVTITGMGFYTGSATAQFDIVEQNIESAAIEDIAASYVYTGSAIEPVPTVKDGDTVLTDADYSVSYSKDTVNAGEVTLTVTGKGNYTGTKPVTYTITPKPVTGITIGGVSASYEYTGSAIKPIPTVKDGNKTLTNDDYSVSYTKDTVNVGDVTLTVTGKGNYTGTKTVKFSITPKSITSAKISAIDDRVYTGTKIKPSVTVTLNGSRLKSEDFTIRYGSNVNTGKGSVTITGTGNYNGSVTKNFLIKPKKMTKAKVSSPKKGQLVVQWTKAKGNVTGYQIQYSTDKSFKKGVKSHSVKGAAKQSYTVKSNLKSGQKYYVRVRSYKIVDGVERYGAYSTVSNAVTVKKK